MFAIVPVYNASFENESRTIQPAHIEEVRPHANVPVDPGAVDTACVEVFFHSGNSIVVLLDMSTINSHLQALTGVFDDYGSLL